MLYTNVYGLEKLPVRKAKAKFISAVLPSILIAKYEIDQRRMKVESLLKKKEWTSADSIFYDEMKNRYRAKTDDELKIRIGSLPTSLVLAQAAVESGWGKSRFFLEANNLFGVWSYNIHDSRIPARIARKNKRTYLRSYKDMSESIVHYFEILARSRSYKSLREARVKTDDPFELLPHLKYFSERRTLYTTQLRQIIKRNNFTQFDRYEIDPQYIQEDIVED
ncbi:MAG TPA: glucosaminidase domain-containing protein [Cyclobacteriaceae bacterium]|nr:glucosaminidase domain-containing protein [Cyclobacteriaceae bacterium]